MRAAFVLGFLLVGLAVPAEVAQAQGRLTKDWRVGVEYLASLRGVAFCREEGGFYMVRGGLSAMDKAGTEAHEAKHLEQHTRFKSCKAFYAWYDTPRGKLEIEAEAFAAGGCAQIAMGADPVSTRAMHLQLLIQYYVPGTPIYEASRVYARYEKCS